MAPLQNFRREYGWLISCLPALGGMCYGLNMGLNGLVVVQVSSSKALMDDDWTHVLLFSWEFTLAFTLSFHCTQDSFIEQFCVGRFESCFATKTSAADHDWVSFQVSCWHS